MATSDQADWRLQGQARYLQGVNLVHRQYRRYPGNPDWDHDHCEFCGSKFMVEDYPEVLHQGYTTEDDYHWICDPCFADFREMFNWQVVEAGTIHVPRNAAIELHDSKVAEIAEKDGSVTVRFKSVCLHKSDGRPGHDAGSCWTQSARLVFTQASFSGCLPELPCTVIGGRLDAGESLGDGLIQVPLDVSGPVELSLVFDNVHSVIIRGRGVSLKMSGKTRYVEDFKPSPATVT